MSPVNRKNPFSHGVISSTSWGQTPSLRSQAALPEAWTHETQLPEVEAGSLFLLRQFDIGDEVDLPLAERLLSSTQRTKMKKRSSALILSNPPLTAPLGKMELKLGELDVDAEVVAKIFDFGVVSIRIKVLVPKGTSWTGLNELVVAALSDESITPISRRLCRELVTRIADAIEDPHEKPMFEDYVIAHIERFSPSIPATSLPLDALARLLLGEAVDAPLSEQEIRDATRNRSSYFGEDLCISSWACALVVEPSGDLDPVEVMELANAQLLELRFYDELLDEELSRLYDEVELRRGRGPLLFRSYGPVLRRAITVMLEIAEFIERVENALKIIGDVYLARIYASTVDALRIPSWEQSVTRKHDLVSQVYDVLKAEVDASRGQLLEVTIVLLILIEIVMAVVTLN